MKIKTTIGACSYEDGIEFFLQKKIGYSSRARLLKNGEIEVSIVEKEHSFLNKSKCSLKEKIIMFFMIIIIMYIMNLVNSPLLKHILNMLIVWCFVIVFFYTGSKNPSTRRFHGAEHKVLNAFETLKRIPTIEEALRYSRYYMFCGGTIVVVLLSIVTVIYFGLVIFDHIVFSALFIIIMLYLVLKLWANDQLNFLQNFTTAEPTVIEIKVAIEGLKGFIKEEGLD